MGGFLSNIGSALSSGVKGIGNALGDAGSYALDSIKGGGLFDDLGPVGGVLFPSYSGLNVLGDLGLPTLPNYGVLTGGIAGTGAPYAGGAWGLSSLAGLGGASELGASTGAAPGVPSLVSSSSGPPAVNALASGDIIGDDIITKIFGDTFSNASGANDIGKAITSALGQTSSAQGSLLQDILPLLTAGTIGGLQAYSGAALQQAQQDFLNAQREDEQQAAIDLANVKGEIESKQLAAQLAAQIGQAQANAAIQKQQLVQQAFSNLISNALAGGTGAANALGNLATLGQRALG